jgi:SAM-dependent methyltransferase
MRKRLRRIIRPAWLGGLRRTKPLSDHWGYDRGTPVDRYYIERFLKDHRQDIHGHVLEVQSSGYADRYGIGIERCDVIDIDPTNPEATIVADLTQADTIPSDLFDCIILTQTLQLIYQARAAVAQAHRILKTGGILLVTVPSVSRIVHDHEGSDYWRFTVASCSALFGEVFGEEHVTIRSYGNVLTAIAFLTGMAHEELSNRELNANDNAFPVVITIRAAKLCNI